MEYIRTPSSIFHYLGQGFHHILFLKLIYSNTKRGQSPLDHIIIFEDFMLYPIFEVL